MRGLEHGMELEEGGKEVKVGDMVLEEKGDRVEEVGDMEVEEVRTQYPQKPQQTH